MNPSKSAIRFAKRVANYCGLEVTRAAKTPRLNLLGLRRLPIGTILDVGANTGQFARQIGPSFPGARIVCFEPLEGPFRELRAWAEGEQGRVTTFNLALGEAPGKTEMNLHVDHSTSSSILATTDVTETLYPFTKSQTKTMVELSTLDAVVADLELTPQILIKMDVQGFEDRVIRGGIKTFELAVACIVEVNLDELYEGQARFAQIVDLLDGLTYTYAGNLVQEIDSDGHCISLDAVFVRR